jgi:hypothetical protein
VVNIGSMNRVGRFGVAAVSTAIAIGMVAPLRTAVAAVVSGSNLGAAPNGGTCMGTYPGQAIECTATISTLPVGSRAAGGARAGIDGVIVSWKVSAALASTSHTIALRVVRGVADAGLGPQVTLPAAAGVYTYAARMPVQAGDELGVEMFEVEQSSTMPIIRTGVLGATTDFWYPALLPGQEKPPTVDEGEFELLMNATIEPDADHDGYGDETQDQCATAAGPGVCPTPPAPVPRPDTAITKGPSGTIHARNVSFSFRSAPAGATFECKFDKRPFKPCGSPRKYKHLGLGKHKFQVRAVNSSGSDSIPASRAFKIVP